MNKLELINLINKAIETIENSADYLENYDAIETVGRLKELTTELRKKDKEEQSVRESLLEKTRKRNEQLDSARDMPTLISELAKNGMLDEEDLNNIRTLNKASSYYREMFSDIHT